jgi:hypothetical protein
MDNLSAGIVNLLFDKVPFTTCGYPASLAPTFCRLKSAQSDRLRPESVIALARNQ